MICIPLEILNVNNDGFHLLVEVVVFGHPFIAVLDTGASRSVLDKTLILQHLSAEEVILSEQLSTGLGTISMESFTCTIPQFSIGSFTVDMKEFAVLDLSTIKIAYEQIESRTVAGVIGGDLLMQYGAIIDYNTCELRFMNTSSL